MTKKENKVISFILKAQQASMSAKQTCFCSRRDSFYAIKDRCIKQAVSILKSLSHSRIQYSLKYDSESYMYVWYFEFKTKGQHWQFSFHKPYEPCDHTQGCNAIVWNYRKSCKKNFGCLQDKR